MQNLQTRQRNIHSRTPANANRQSPRGSYAHEHTQNVKYEEAVMRFVELILIKEALIWMGL